MGSTCCQQNTQQGLLFQVSDVPKATDYMESDWPTDDEYLKSKLALSQIGKQNHQLKPMKHKIYDRWYYGEWNNGQPSGKGILYMKGDLKSTYYEGDFIGQPNGKGKVIFNEGEGVYEGEIRDARAEGQGCFRNYKEGSTFSGQWKDSKPYKGQLLLQRVQQINGNQEILISTVIIDEQKEQNVIKYPDGRVYTGRIDKSRFIPHGKGRVQFPNGSSYDGEWELGQMHGKGKFQWADKSSYEGDYLFGRKHGRGRFIFASGNYYEGYWVDGKQNGKGILYSSKSDQLKNGQWKDGNFVGPQKITREST